MPTGFSFPGEEKQKRQRHKDVDAEEEREEREEACWWREERGGCSSPPVHHGGMEGDGDLVKKIPCGQMRFHLSLSVY